VREGTAAIQAAARQKTGAIVAGFARCGAFLTLCVADGLLECAARPALCFGFAAVTAPLSFPKERATLAGYAGLEFWRVDQKTT
jgi:hypothetical protein